MQLCSSDNGRGAVSARLPIGCGWWVDALSLWCGDSSKHREAVPCVVGCGGGHSGVGGGGRCAQAAAAGSPHPPLSDRHRAFT
jgi:hypothetical protein